MMDRGIVVAAERFAHAGLPDRRGGDPYRRGGRDGGRGRGAGGRRRGGGALEPHPQRPGGRRRGRTRADLEGAQERVRLGGDDRAPLPPARPRRPRTKLVDVLTGVYEIAARHELVVTNVFHAGDGNLHPLLSFDRSVPGRSNASCARARRSSACASRRAGRSRASTGSGSRSATSCRWCSRRGPRGAGVRAVGVRPRGTDEPAEGAAGRRSVWRLRDGARLGRRVGRGGPPGGLVDLIHPSSKADVVTPSATRTRPATPARGRRATASRQGQPLEVDAELWTTQLDRLVAYEPAEMIAVVEAGMRVGELERILAEGGQEWPSDAPNDATVGGVIASGASSPRRLRSARCATPSSRPRS